MPIKVVALLKCLQLKLQVHEIASKAECIIPGESYELKFIPNQSVSRRFGALQAPSLKLRDPKGL